MNERLQEIKQWFHDWGEVEDHQFDWLIEQAEKVEQLEQEIEHLQDELARWEAGLNQTKEMYELQRQLRQAQAKAERYKNHLLCIQRHYGLPSEPTDFVPVTVLHEIQMIVSNALEGES
jgi:predicted nuclease with TOPRIM domain